MGESREKAFETYVKGFVEAIERILKNRGLNAEAVLSLGFNQYQDTVNHLLRNGPDSGKRDQESAARFAADQRVKKAIASLIHEATERASEEAKIAMQKRGKKFFEQDADVPVTLD